MQLIEISIVMLQQHIVVLAIVPWGGGVFLNVLVSFLGIHEFGTVTLVTENLTCSRTIDRAMYSACVDLTSATERISVSAIIVKKSPADNANEFPVDGDSEMSNTKR